MIKKQQSKNLLKMQKFLKDLGLESHFDCDGRLILLTSEDKHLEIIEKTNELGIKYTQERKPVYGPLDPITLRAPIQSFIINEWFEEDIV